MLLDPGSPFLELSASSPPTACTAATCPAAGIITGIGRVVGPRMRDRRATTRRSRAAPTIPMTVKKHLRAQEIARENRLPCIYLVDSGGALPARARTTCSPTASTSAASSTTRPTCRPPASRRSPCVMGSCTAGGAYVPAMSDESDHRQEPGHDLPRRPAAGEGGDRRGRHAPRSSAAPTCTRASPASPTTTRMNDAHALAHRAAHRRAISTSAKQPALAHARARASRSTTPRRSTASSRPTRASPTTCARSSPASSTAPSSTSSSSSTARRWSPASRTSAGYPVGILANNGILFSESALKAAHFIELCCQRGIPLVFLQNITGFMVGKKYEAGGIAKDGAKMVTAVACAQGAEVHRDHRRQLRRRQLRHVRPRLSARASCGCGRTRASRSWAASRRPACSRRCGATISRRKEELVAEEEEAFKAPIREQYERQGHPYYASARLWDDGIVDPADTRRVLGLGALGLAQRADRRRRASASSGCDA